MNEKQNTKQQTLKAFLGYVHLPEPDRLSETVLAKNEKETPGTGTLIIGKCKPNYNALDSEYITI